MQKNRLNATARRGLVSLIPKKKSGIKVEDYRPITLLCYDYKILAKAISNRMDMVLPDIINPEQVGFMKNRSIFNNLRTMMEVVSYLNKKNLPGVIAIVDFSKCFDRIEYEAIKGAFKFFEFPESFIKWLFLLFNQFSFCTQNNGFTSEYISKGRGVNQGCPASPGAYTVTSAVMAYMIKTNRNIKGILMYKIEQILSQFADDTGAYLSYEYLTIEHFCQTLKDVENNMGLKVSYGKTSLYRVGSLHNTNARMYTTNELNWSNDPIESLGVTIANDGTLLNCNADAILTKIDKTCNNWYNRKLSLSGKILVVNVLMGSLFVYKMSTLSNFPDTVIKEAEKKIVNFLWNGKKAKIALKNSPM